MSDFAPVDDDNGVILLMRHGQHVGGRLTDASLSDTRNVTRRLAEWLDGTFRRRHEVVIVATGSPEVLQTARLVYHELHTAVENHKTQRSRHPSRIDVTWGGSLANQDLADEVELPHVDDPRGLGAYRPDQAAIDGFNAHLRRVVRQGKSIVLVGNDPFVGWLAGDLTGRESALARGELLCLGRHQGQARKWHLLWNIAEEPATLAEEIRAKIKSKMDSAKALGAVLVGLLTYLLTRGLAQLTSPLAWFAVAAIGSAALLYFGTLFLYDSLLMPHRFWGSRRHGASPNRLGWIGRRWTRGPRTVQRPPASTERVLHDAMTHIWRWIFQPATALVGVGVALLAAAAAADAPKESPPSLLTVLGCTVGLAAAATLYVLWHRPRLGATD